MRVGVVALQGDVLEHLQILRELGVEAVPVKRPRELSAIDAIVLPGGESTTIGELMTLGGLMEPLRDAILAGTPVMGTCAGAILMAKKIADRVTGVTGQRALEVMDISVIRNAFGRQRESFVAEIEMEGLGKVRAAFIRAPAIVEAWGSARITARLQHRIAGDVGVAAEQSNMMALAFHPEVTGEKKVFEYFLKKAKR